MSMGWLMWKKAGSIMVSPEVSDFTELSFDLEGGGDYFMRWGRWWWVTDRGQEVRSGCSLEAQWILGSLEHWAAGRNMAIPRPIHLCYGEWFYMLHIWTPSQAWTQTVVF